MRRLGVNAVDNNIPNLRLDREQFSVEIRGKGGLCLKHLHHDATIVQFQQAPDICFLQIDESDIAKDIVSLASFLHEGIGVRRVIIGQLLCRLPYAACSNFN